MEEVASISERIAHITENFDLHERQAKALILAEMGYSASGISAELGVATSTASGYLEALENEIGEGVTETLPKSKRHPTFPGDTVSDPEYSGDYIDYAPKFKDRETPLNRGPSLEEIDDSLITIKS